MNSIKRKFSFWRSAFVASLATFSMQAMSQADAAKDAVASTPASDSSSFIWWLVIAAMVILLLAIGVLGNVLIVLAKVSVKKAKGAATILLLLLAFAANAQDAAQPATASASSLPDISVILACIVLLAEIAVIAILVTKIMQFSSKLTAKEEAKPTSSEPSFLTQLFWKYGMAVISVITFGYILYDFVFEIGKPEPVAVVKPKEPEINELNVTMADAAGIKEGKSIYDEKCGVCHGAAGEGVVGPNLTDDYWLHGGSLGNIFHTITVGVPDKGMISWKDQLTPAQIRDCASYIKSLHGTKPANPKEPQGELYKDDSAASNATPAADTSAKAKS